MVSSSFDPAKEFSSIEFFKKIYPVYLFAKLHSTLFRWQISLVNLVIHRKSSATKTSSTLFLSPLQYCQKLYFKKRNLAKRADYFQTRFFSIKSLSFFGQEGRFFRTENCHKNGWRLHLLRMVRNGEEISLGGQKYYRKNYIKRGPEVSSSF